ncbi:Uncharacterized membrane protein [Modicisalibacter ilicicola DSM 19980]|uniref:Uncharacterized membrane protein n=1 Tax=Modicisalibacter ilicicola DSM 19980 TaxID=1121942 RepID=A0A1M4ZTF6_9GAMM|nr:hypothetical protein [Halomonas ilicicola]SHF21329.1 Uncharacterized membrane protein [Halomonas ilicicola DSM 19980]
MTAPSLARPTPRPTLVTLLCGLLMLAWPLLVFLLLPRDGALPLLALGVALICWRLPVGYRRWGLLLGAVVAMLALLGDANLGVRAWPVLINAALLGLFAWSLRHPPTLIERLARRWEPDLPPSGVRYTRRVTQLWCGFFFVNGAIALWTALYADLATWTLYNGGIAYGLSGALFIGEWCVRQRARGKEAHD